MTDLPVSIEQAYALWAEPLRRGERSIFVSYYWVALHNYTECPGVFRSPLLVKLEEPISMHDFKFAIYNSAYRNKSPYDKEPDFIWVFAAPFKSDVVVALLS